MQPEISIRVHSPSSSRSLLVSFATVLGAVASCDQTPPSNAPPRANLKIALETLPHSHVFKDVAITFSVRDYDQCINPSDVTTCPGVAGLPVVASVQAKGFKQEQALKPGTLEDKGGGLYTLYRNLPTYGGNVLGLRFEREGQNYSEIFPLDTSRGGGERYLCDANHDGTPDFAYQIRWNTSTGPVLASGQPEIFSIELSRSFNAPPLNITEPYKNSFDSLRPAELTGQSPTVKLMAGTSPLATEVATLTPTYVGKGIYSVTRPFTAADLAGQSTRTFWLQISFTDDKGCTVSGADETEYYFSLTP